MNTNISSIFRRLIDVLAVLALCFAATAAHAAEMAAQRVEVGASTQAGVQAGNDDPAFKITVGSKPDYAAANSPEKNVDPTEEDKLTTAEHKKENGEITPLEYNMQETAAVVQGDLSF